MNDDMTDGNAGMGAGGTGSAAASDAGNAEMIAARLFSLGLPDTNALAGKLAVYMRMLRDWNTRINLTRIIEPYDIADRHFAESLGVLTKFDLPETGRMIDVGTGAGFPGLVLAMALPGWEVTLLDARAKRLNFLSAVCEATGTANVKIIHARAEDAGRENGMREAFDIAAARAVAKLDLLCSLLLPFVKPGGLALCWKGPSWTEERAAAEHAAKRLGGVIEEAVDCAFGTQPGRMNLIIPVRKKRGMHITAFTNTNVQAVETLS